MLEDKWNEGLDRIIFLCIVKINSFTSSSLIKKGR